MLKLFLFIMILITILNHASSNAQTTDQHDSHDEDHENHTLPEDAIRDIFDELKGNDTESNNETLSMAEFEILYDALFPNPGEHGEHNHKKRIAKLFLKSKNKSNRNKRTFEALIQDQDW